MKRLISILAITLTVLVSSSCSFTKGIQITSCSISSISPEGLKSIKAMLNLGIENPFFGFTIPEIVGTINNDGKSFATIQTGSVAVNRFSEGIYPVQCKGTISNGVGIMDLLKLAALRDYSKMTVDMDVKIQLKWGFGTTLKFKGIKVTDLIDTNTASIYLDQIIEALS